MSAFDEDFGKKWVEFSPDDTPSFGIHWGKDTELLLKVAQRLLDLEERVAKQEKAYQDELRKQKKNSDD